MKTIIKYFIIFYIFLNSFTPLNSESLLLKDGKIFKGKLVNLSKQIISLEINDKIYDFSFNTIEYLIAQSSQSSYTTIIIKKNNGEEDIVYLIKLTNTALYYKYNNENDLKIFKLSDIFSISVKKQSNYRTNNNTIIYLDNIIENKNIDVDINQTIFLLLEYKKDERLNNQDFITELNKTNLENIINIDSADFYDKFWLKINKYLDLNSSNLLWNLIENYSDKEKTLNIIYNEKLSESVFLKEASRLSISDELKNKINSLRIDFYKRAKKIILSAIK